MKIRIKVLIDSNGLYCGYGYSGAVPSELNDTLYEVVTHLPSKEYWVTADLPLPEITEVAGTVSA